VREKVPLPTILEVLRTASGRGGEAPAAINFLERHRRALARELLSSNQSDGALAKRLHEVAPLAAAAFPWDPTPQDVDLSQAILEHWRLNEMPAPNVLLATMALAPAHHFPIAPRLSAVPAWLRVLYTRYLLAHAPMFLHSGEADRYAAHGAAAMAMVHAAIFEDRLAESSELADHAAETNSSLMYFNAQSLRSYFRHKARITEWALMRQGLSLGMGRRLTPSSKPRIGILHKALSPGTETYHLLAYLEGRDRSAADVTIYYLETAPNAMVEAFAPWVDAFVQLPHGARPAAARMRAERLDLCFVANNVGWGLSREGAIAAHRLAAVQIVCGACPATAGFSSSDIFLSSEASDCRPDAQADYVERLAFLPGSVGHFAFAHDRDAPTIKPSRADLGVPDDHVLFFTGANFYKIQPEVLETWAEILARLPRSSLVLMPFNPNWGGDYAVELFRRRMNRVLARFGVGANRVRLIDQVPTRADLLSVMALTDIYLDSFPYSGACSLVDPLTVGLPIVGRAGDKLRTAQGGSLLRGEGLDSAVCADTESYIQRAARLARDPAFRTAERGRAASVARQLACLQTGDFAARFQVFCLGSIAATDARTARLRSEPAPNLRQAIARAADLVLSDPAPQFAFARDAHLLEQITGPYLEALMSEGGGGTRIGCIGERAVKAAAALAHLGVEVGRLGREQAADIVVIDEPGVTSAALRRLKLDTDPPKAIVVCLDGTVARPANKGVKRAAAELAVGGYEAIAFKRKRSGVTDWLDEITGVALGAAQAGYCDAGIVFFYREADSAFLTCVLVALEMACLAPLRPTDAGDPAPRGSSPRRGREKVPV
jgi:predicted O-linked N-acetylglucosamine transferase (SPINDLY family)